MKLLNLPFKPQLPAVVLSSKVLNVTIANEHSSRYNALLNLRDSLESLFLFSLTNLRICKSEK